MIGAMKKLRSFTFYFLYFASLSAFIPYIVLFYRQQGFTGWQIGLLTSLGPLASLVGGLIWTSLADATHRHRQIMGLAGLTAIGIVLLYPGTTHFASMLVLVLLYSFVLPPVMSLADTATMLMLGKEQSIYGRLRLGGTIGWGIFAPIIGTIIDRVGLTWLFSMYAGGLFLALLLGQTFTFPSSQSSRPNIRLGIKTLLANPSWVLFLQTAFICGFGMAIIYNYQPLYMQNLGTNKAMIGFSMTISTLSELPIMFFSNFLLRKIKAAHLIVLALGMIGVRLVLIAWFNTPLAIILIGAFHGLTFPAMWLAGVTFSQENAPPGMSATAQGIFSSVSMSFGASTGSFVGGLLLGAMDVRGVYYILGATVLAAFGVISILRFRMTRQQARFTTETASYEP